MFFQRQKKAAKRQHGFLSIEVIVVLVIVLGLIGLGASKMDLLTGNSNATEELSNVQSLYASAKGLKTTSGYGTSGTELTSQLISTQSVPKNISVVSGVMYNLWGGSITVVSNGNNFTITSSGMPTQGCVKLATAVSKSGIFATTSINGGTAITGEVTSAAASSQCANSANAVAWTTTA